MTVRVRMAPSPTGSPHVGLVRTALFNWAFARHHGGTIVLRIEDTDAARNTQESYDSILDLFAWLGFDWDEGPGVGGPYAPYRQSERTELYRDALSRLRESQFTYDCFCTTAEVDDAQRSWQHDDGRFGRVVSHLARIDAPRPPWWTTGAR